MPKTVALARVACQLWQSDQFFKLTTLPQLHYFVGDYPPHCGKIFDFTTISPPHSQRLIFLKRKKKIFTKCWLQGELPSVIVMEKWTLFKLTHCLIILARALVFSAVCLTPVYIFGWLLPCQYNPYSLRFQAFYKSHNNCEALQFG